MKFSLWRPESVRILQLKFHFNRPIISRLFVVLLKALSGGWNKRSTKGPQKCAIEWGETKQVVKGCIHVPSSGWNKTSTKGPQNVPLNGGNKTSGYGVYQCAIKWAKLDMWLWGTTMRHWEKKLWELLWGKICVWDIAVNRSPISTNKTNFFLQQHHF